LQTALPVGVFSRTRSIWQAFAVGSLHPAVAAPLGDVVTRRLSVHRLTGDDLDGLAAIFANADVWRFEYGRGLNRVETDAFLSRQLKLWVDYGFGGCAVREVERPELIGVVGLAVPMVFQDRLPPVTVGWRFSPTVWGKGYGTEAATAVLDQAFGPMALDRVGCVTNADNLRSVAVAERLGLRFITEAPVLREDGKGVVSAALFQIARDEWLAARADRSPST
jgi:RimJ/RimL family protein N-acetyltransferase